ncbi:MAG: hypothetical protein ACRC3H_00250 [Lachnospiraceae bacterium]
MMSNSLAEFFFAKALNCADESNLTAALRYSAIALGLMPTDEKKWRLAGLCYYQMGNYEMAGYCFGQLPNEREDWQAAVLKKMADMKTVTSLAEHGEYKKAVNFLAAAEKTIGQWNYLGCLYAILGQKKKAADCFVTALMMDRGNVDALAYLSGLEQMKKRKWWQIWQ